MLKEKVRCTEPIWGDEDTSVGQSWTSVTGADPKMEPWRSMPLDSDDLDWAVGLAVASALTSDV